ncbi:Flagellar hook-length control protein FliK [Shewanella psychrophila]|uniref:Flagellar hook-length control protein FliK n=1 Tax=Shewanella psychrophila TaxID=225848 RepID=A0A1S6HTN3_9GAMM|nr:flagellar hook-length control protein FliK [Shewanella psychrophila]AQS38895.1 Flagellar hook-length control protein FliK [Shewanella psychrophila]
MQKMTNILLTNKDNVSDNLSVGGIKQGDKSRAQSSESNDFSSALEQANTQARESNRAKNANVEKMSATESSQANVERDEAALEGDPQAVDDAVSNVDHVLAQINLASQLEANTNLDNSGDSLPLEGSEKTTSDPTLDDYLLSVVDGAENTELNFPAQETIQADEVIADIVGTEQSQTVSNVELETLLINPDTQVPLDKNLIDKLVLESGLSEAELAFLPPEKLIQLISTVTSSDSQTVSVGSAVVGGEIRKGHESRSAGLIQSTNNLPLSEAETSDKSVGFKDIGKVNLTHQGAGNDVLTRTENQIDQGSTKLPVEAMTKAEQQLKGAELSVQLNPLKSSLDGGTTLSDTSSTSNTDIKTLSGLQIGSTSQSKSEIPQFQLVLRQNNDTQSQMQEMIQRFSPVMKQQLVTMVSQGIQHAEIRLDPPELGSLMIRIQVQGDQTQVHFQVAQHQTRDIVEQALPRLKELLAEQGLQLSDSQVSQRDSGKDQGETGHSEHSQEGYDSELDEISADESLLSSNQASSYRSGIDYYA